MKKAELENILKYGVCKKGCGEVELVKYGDDIICDCCGEEMYGLITTQHFNYLLKNARELKVEE